MLKNGGEVEREELVEVKRSDGDTVTVLPYFYRRHIFHFYGFIVTLLIPPLFYF